ncbi:MAG: hypothetical protein EXR76_16020 [Myxococcales bacterium]|nr:hypothetical protein [Myxococcales bacterium]
MKLGDRDHVGVLSSRQRVVDCANRDHEPMTRALGVLSRLKIGQTIRRGDPVQRDRDVAGKTPHDLGGPSVRALDAALEVWVSTGAAGDLREPVERNVAGACGRPIGGRDLQDLIEGKRGPDQLALGDVQEVLQECVFARPQVDKGLNPCALQARRPVQSLQGGERPHEGQADTREDEQPYQQEPRTRGTEHQRHRTPRLPRPRHVFMLDMKQFLLGNDAFRGSYVAEARSYLERLASEKQSPSALYIGCSDSRVIPELLTSSSPGELFVVRNVANIVPAFEHADASVGAALEYAVAVLNVEHIVVCGHSGCGGIKAIVDGHAALRALPNLHQWLDDAAQPLQAELDRDLPGSSLVDRLVERNVLAQLCNLNTYPVVAERLQAGVIQLHGWVYDLPTGRVRVFDVNEDTFVHFDGQST